MISVVMNKTRLGEDGKQWRAGDTYPASESFGKELIGRGDAYASDYSLPDVALTAQQVGALVSDAGIVQVPRILHCSTNITSTSDTAPTTANALASFVLPASAMGANGLLRFTVACKGLDSLGAKNIRIWANSTQLFAVASGSLNNNVLVQHQFIWFNGGAEGSQNTYYNQPTVYGSPSATIGNTGINTAIQQTIYLTADSATAAGPTVAKHLFLCELLRNQ